MTTDTADTIAAPVLIRHAVVADYEELCPLFAALDAQHRIARPDQVRAADSAPRTREQVDSLIAGPHTALLVAEHAGRLVGFATLALHQRMGLPIVVPARVAAVDGLFVEPAHRRAGIGRALLARARAWAQAKDARTIEISTHAFNQDALRFYEATGYATATRRLMAQIA